MCCIIKKILHKWENGTVLRRLIFQNQQLLSSVLIKLFVLPLEYYRGGSKTYSDQATIVGKKIQVIGFNVIQSPSSKAPFLIVIQTNAEMGRNNQIYRKLEQYGCHQRKYYINASPDDDNPNYALQEPAAQALPAGSKNSTLPLMQDLLAQTARTPEQKRQTEQLASAVTLAEQYYNAKAAELDPTGERATARVREAPHDRVEASLGLELNMKDTIEHSGSNDLIYEAEVCKFAVANQQASFAAISSMAITDYKSATMWMLTAHHLARVIAGDAQQRREVELLPEQLKSILSKQSGPVAVLASQSKKKLAENIKTIKLIQFK
ncbi:MAG: hypothetical protein EZS28_016014 [Streblomastix strix]|uniref:Uncharacterized protein n=1 Tax=Streblomastix strix TaxID=222440 RepID=A0A5J4W0P8_9EUKA|nr:MAG: hypothetical protein EZS28_016014 [Streblomastix strix]